MFVNMVAAGELGGNLVKNLQIIATQQQKIMPCAVKLDQLLCIRQ